MKSTPCALRLAWLLPAVLLGAARPALAEAAMRQTDVFAAGESGYFGYRIPALETAPDGTLLAFAEARRNNLGDPGHEGNDIDLVIKRSVDGGATWSAMKVIEDPGDRWSAANPATVVDRRNGRIWLLYLQCKPGRNTETARPGTDDSRILARTSDDQGASWSEPIDLTTISRDMADPKWRCSVVGPGGGIQTKDGRLAFAVWRYEPWGAFAMFSEDQGRTWQRGAMIPGLAGDECQLVELADGHLLIDVRQHSGPHRWMATSSDGGRSWSEARPGPTVTPVCCAIERLERRASRTGGDADDRDRILWTGPRGPGRSNLVVRVSYDEAKTFPRERAVAAGPAAYSDLAILKDGSIGVLWERGVDRGYQFITFGRFDRKWLED